MLRSRVQRGGSVWAGYVGLGGVCVQVQGLRTHAQSTRAEIDQRASPKKREAGVGGKSGLGRTRAGKELRKRVGVGMKTCRVAASRDSFQCL